MDKVKTLVASGTRIGFAIRQALLERDLTVTAFAEKYNLNEKAVSSAIHGSVRATEADSRSAEQGVGRDSRRVAASHLARLETRRGWGLISPCARSHCQEVPVLPCRKDSPPPVPLQTEVHARICLLDRRSIWTLRSAQRPRCGAGCGAFPRKCATSFTLSSAPIRTTSAVTCLASSPKSPLRARVSGHRSRTSSHPSTNSALN
jgi:hypothetical protein